MYCEHCGTENDIDAKFCISCGESLEPIEQTKNKLKNDKNNANKKSKTLPVIVFLIAIAIIIIIIIAIAKNGNNSSYSGLLPSYENKKNHQVIATTLLDRELPNYGLLQYAFTNGGECIDRVYGFKSNPAEFTESENYIEDYENNFTMKYCFLYRDGNKDDDLQVQEYYRENSGDEPWYDNQYHFVKDFENKQSLSAYYSYEIDRNGNIWNEDDFRYLYDEYGKLTEISNGSSNTSYYYYDGYGVLSEKHVDNESTTYTYEKDSYGNIVQVTKYKGESKKRYCEYEYDSNNNITKESYYFFNSDGEQQLFKTTLYTYDENENITSISVEKYSEYTGNYEDTETTTYYYNNNNNVIKATISDMYSTIYMVFEYTDDPTSYHVEN